MISLMDYSAKKVAEAKSTVEAIHEKIKDIHYDEKDLVSEIKICISNDILINTVQVGKNQETLLMLIAKENIRDITKTIAPEILNSDPKTIFLRDRLDNNALMHAAIVNNLDFLEEVKDHIDSDFFNRRNKDDKTAFMLAVQHNHRDFLEKLFELGIEIPENMLGESLVLAIECRHTAVLELLLLKDASIHEKKTLYLTLWSLANCHNHVEGVSLLDEYITNNQSTLCKWTQDFSSFISSSKEKVTNARLPSLMTSCLSDKNLNDRDKEIVIDSDEVTDCNHLDGNNTLKSPEVVIPTRNLNENQACEPCPQGFASQRRTLAGKSNTHLQHSPLPQQPHDRQQLHQALTAFSPDGLASLSTAPNPNRERLLSSTTPLSRTPRWGGEFDPALEYP